MCIAKGVVAHLKWGIIRDYPEYDERELDSWLACLTPGLSIVRYYTLFIFSRQM